MSPRKVGINGSASFSEGKRYSGVSPAWRSFAGSGCCCRPRAWSRNNSCPSPWSVVSRFAQLLVTPFAGASLPQHLMASAERYLYGLALAAVIGIPLGLLMGWFRLLDDIVSPIFESLRFIAPIAWVPFAALWFGTGIGGPVMIIFAGAFPPCLINAYRGARFIDPRLIEASRMLGTGSSAHDCRNSAAGIRPVHRCRSARGSRTRMAVSGRCRTHRGGQWRGIS